MDKKKIKKEKKSKQTKQSKQTKPHQKKSSKSKKLKQPNHKNKGQKGGRKLIPEIDILGGDKDLKLEKLAEDKKLLSGFPSECVIL